MPAQFHLPLQLVGGVGRSLVASLLAEWAVRVTPTRPPLLFDADPWSGWAFAKKMSMRPFGDLAFGDHVDQRLLDVVVEQTLAAGETAIIDPGGALALDVAEYFLAPVHADTIAEHGQMVAHFIVTGGVRQRATTTSALELAHLLPAASRVVLWKNEFFGRIDRVSLERILARFPRHIDAAVDLPHGSDDLARDLQEVITGESTAARNTLTMASRRLLEFFDGLGARLACLTQPLSK